jgi:hypothetical protein
MAFVLGGSAVLSAAVFLVLVGTGGYDLASWMDLTSYDNGFLELWPFWTTWLLLAAVFNVVARHFRIFPATANAPDPETADPLSLLEFLGLHLPVDHARSNLT